MPHVSPIALRFEEAYRACTQTLEPVTLDDARFVLVSDLHRGRGAEDAADDHQRCAAATVEALTHYYDRGHTLFMLGDVEELWEVSENAWTDIFLAHQSSFDLERAFIEETRYHRVFGNHDLAWASSELVQEYLEDELGLTEVPEAIRVPFTDDGEVVGGLYLTHGHQGELFSDTLRGVSEVIVREVWARLQRGLDVRSTHFTDAFHLREGGRDEDIYFDWAVLKPGTVAVMGHTHKMVFEQVSGDGGLPDRTRRYITKLRRRADAPASYEMREALQKKANWYAERYERALATSGPDTFQPSFFNTGCCAYNNGYLSVIEIENGRIALVIWSNIGGEIQRNEVRSLDLGNVFAAVQPGEDADFWDQAEVFHQL